jgi:hypothetical protein
MTRDVVDSYFKQLLAETGDRAYALARATGLSSDKSPRTPPHHLSRDWHDATLAVLGHQRENDWVDNRGHVDQNRESQRRHRRRAGAKRYQGARR